VIPNTAQVRTLVMAQLRLDLRHSRTGATQTSRAVLTVASYAFSSAVLALSLASRGVSVEELLFAGLSFAVVLAAFGVAGSYDDLMGRPRDHARALAYPLSEATLYTARLANVTIFALAMSVSAALPLAGLATWMFGAGMGLTVGVALIATMLGVTFGVLAAVWGLTLAVPARVQRPLLSGLRAALIGALVLGYQWVATQETLVVSAPWWPAHWVVAAGWGGSLVAWATLLAVTGALGVLYLGVLPSRYIRVLQRTAEAEGNRKGGRRASAAPGPWERWAVRTPEARAAYGFAAAALRGDRLVVGRVWPATLLALVFAAFGWWMGGLGDLFAYGAWGILVEPAVQMHLSVLTVLLFVAQSSAQALQVTDHPEAAWAFDIFPVRSERALQIGAQQALVFRVLLPLHGALAVLLALSMPVVHALIHAAFWLAGCALLSRVYALTRRTPPFARRSDRFSAGEKFLPLLLAVPAAIALMLVQGVSFAHPLSAALMIAGMFVLHAALGVVGRPAPARREAAAVLAPTPA
jgi:hypothetical protein